MLATPLAGRLMLLLACITLAGCGANDGSAAPPTEADGTARTGAASASHAASVVMRDHALRDPGMNNAVASVVLVPDGWTREGGLSRPSDQLYNMPVIADVKITAADGRAVHFFPSLSFEFNHRAPGQTLQPTLGGKLYLPLPASPGQWFLQMARMRPDTTVSDLQLLSEEALPDLTRQLRQQNAQMFQIVERGNANTASMGFGQSYDTQATKLVVS